MRPKPVPGDGVCLLGAHQAASIASTRCHPTCPLCSMGDPLVVTSRHGSSGERQSSPLPGEPQLLCMPVTASILLRRGWTPQLLWGMKLPTWQHHLHRAELAMPLQQPSSSPVPLPGLSPLAAHQHVAVPSCHGGPMEPHTHPTVGYEGCRAGVRHPTSCSAASSGSCCRKERKNDIPVLERPSSLGRVWEMGPHGNRLWYSLRCEGPRGQPWGEDPGATTSSQGQQPPCTRPARLPAPLRTDTRGSGAAPLLQLCRSK